MKKKERKKERKNEKKERKETKNKEEKKKVFFSSENRGRKPNTPKTFSAKKNADYFLHTVRWKCFLHDRGLQGEGRRERETGFLHGVVLARDISVCVSHVLFT